LSRLPPSFSIIVPTYGRPIQLADCLTSLSALDYPRDRFEVLVVDDGGTEPLDSVIAPFETALDVSLLRQPNAGPGPARNMGAAHARNEFLAFTDDDCLVEPGWLRELAHILVEAPECMAGGLTVNAAPGICATTSQLIVDVVYRHYNSDPEHARFIASNNMAMALREFRDAGGFDPSFRHAEDRDLCDRWRHDGKRIVYSMAARVRHARPMNALAFWRQHFGYGRGAERFNRLRAARGSGTMIVESRFHADIRNWLWYPLTQVPLRHVPSVAALLGTWQVANLAGFMYEKVRRSKDGLRDDALSFS
jgi:glycosyltransferase involved in cell wall biosynthesis